MIPGIHVSTSGGMEKAPQRLRELGLTAGQIFTANQRRWVSPLPSASTIEAFRESSAGFSFVSHASYLINPASSRSDVRTRSERALAAELLRCSVLGIPMFVLHPGAHQDSGLEKGMKTVAGALRRAFDSSEGDVHILLENTAGGGTTLGRTFEELAELRDMTGIPERIGYCIDTAHAHGAGYHVNSPGFLKEMGKVLGFSNVKVIHMNGSKVERGSLRDRHEHFSEGTIPLKALRTIFNDNRLEGALAIAETPGEDADRAADIHSLQKKGDR